MSNNRLLIRQLDKKNKPFPAAFGSYAAICWLDKDFSHDPQYFLSTAGHKNGHDAPKASKALKAVKQAAA